MNECKTLAKLRAFTGGVALSAWIVLMDAGTKATAEEAADNAYAREAYFKAADTDEKDRFGSAVSIAGNVAVVGARDADGEGSEEERSGAAYVFEWASPSGWRQTAYLHAQNRRKSDDFGGSVAVCGDTIVIGARGEDTGLDGDEAHSAGAAFVFTRENDTWVRTAVLKAANAQRSDLFGTSVAISGNTIVVGALFEGGERDGVSIPGESAITDSGAAYVFTRDATGWTQQAYLKASNAEDGDHFGSAVAIDGGTIVVGAPEEDGASMNDGAEPDSSTDLNSGAAYVFEKRDGEWLEQAYLKAPNPARRDDFGGSLAISNQTIVVGARHRNVSLHEGSPPAEETGAAFVFRHDQGGWALEAELIASNAQEEDTFGWSVAIDGDRIAVGAPLEDGRFPPRGDDSNLPANPGAAYVFQRIEGLWQEQAYLNSPNGGSDDLFGYSIGIAGSTILVGAHLEDSNSTGVDGDELNGFAPASGAAYLFRPPVDHLEDIISITSTPSGYHLVMPRARGRLVGVEYSEDLSPHSWIELGNFSVLNGVLQFIDPDPVRAHRRSGYYRAFLRPSVP